MRPSLFTATTRSVSQAKPAARRRSRSTAADKIPARDLEPRKQPQQERSASRVEHVLQSAIELLKEAGATALTTRAIAARAGLPVGSIYQYFPNKQAILAQLAQRWLSQFQETLQRQIEKPAPRTWPAFRRTFHDFHHACAQYYLRNQDLLCVLESLPFDPELRRMEQAHDRKMREMLRDWLLAINPALPRKVTARVCQVWLAAAHACLAGVVVESPDQFGESVDDVERMCLALLRPYLGF